MRSRLVHVFAAALAQGLETLRSYHLDQRVVPAKSLTPRVRTLFGATAVVAFEEGLVHAG